MQIYYYTTSSLSIIDQILPKNIYILNEKLQNNLFAYKSQTYGRNPFG